MNAPSNDQVYAGGSPYFDERAGSYRPEWKSKLPPSAFKDASGTAYTPFVPPANARPVGEQPANTGWAKAWSDAYRPPVQPESFVPAQSYVAPGQQFRRRLNPAAGTSGDRVDVGPSFRGNLAYTPESRPQAFEQRATDFTGATSATPDFGRRDAFIDALNRRLASYQRQATVSTQPIQSSAPQFDIADLWRQAGEARSFRNPFVLRKRS